MLTQDGEFIETFLLPYDGLYDALVVSFLHSASSHQLPCSQSLLDETAMLTFASLWQLLICLGPWPLQQCRCLPCLLRCAIACS